MRLPFLGIWVVLACCCIAILTFWGTLALWFRLPGSDTLRYMACGLIACLGSGAFIAQFNARRFKAAVIFAIAFLGLIGWWAFLEPPKTQDWSPEVVRQSTGVVKGDTLTVTDIRDFEWRADGSFRENWEQQSYDLTELNTVDLFLSYWAGPQMAHFILSFGFEDGQQLAWSVEVRRQKGGRFSPVADFFKENTLVILAATEPDVVGLRANIRGENVQLFRLSADRDVARALLEAYVADANALAQAPEWYNSVSTNCTTVVMKLLSAIGSGLPFDWRLIANGYLPEFGYEQGLLNTDYTVDELRRLGSITQRAQQFGLKPGFSKAIRVGVPIARDGL
ncbi:DUF4105 domain-containing protein (plasmid) [Roseobacter denitrificans]|uniref:Lnb N-terminal periplasmic domain-containing protein n=1 Tax=Roseobacter denitrificans (strain ATCC 33942 / OCh 114) TaxID=375451 RepID=Q07GT9_ROSDO|nr:DUF4105 domain-containing protein [Roseobacter denitrificans]ABI93310.1 hypothetical protein RD1_A0006 [Roseobacter denitrificans OCh 114]AVL51226.1 DUF4105 domain-containing protein [Roseobacter denitrificans]SFG40499.1 protein of unknown function [Roseobacter denitrificans OCh 114]